MHTWIVDLVALLVDVKVVLVNELLDLGSVDWIYGISQVSWHLPFGAVFLVRFFIIWVELRDLGISQEVGGHEFEFEIVYN